MIMGKLEMCDELIGNLVLPNSEESGERVLIGANYGGTNFRVGVYVRDEEVYHRVAILKTSLEGRLDVIESGLREAVDFARETLGHGGLIPLGVGCKGPTDPRTGDNNVYEHYPSWGRSFNIYRWLSERFPDTFSDVVAGNDLMVDAIGSSIDLSVHEQLGRYLRHWNDTHGGDLVDLGNLQTNMIVFTPGTGAGYKTIGKDGSVEMGGEIWTPYVPIELGFQGWAACKYGQKQDDRYLLNVERSVSAAAFGLFLEYVLDTKSFRNDAELREILGDSEEIARRAREGGDAACLDVVRYHTMHMVSLAWGLVQDHMPRSIVFSGWLPENWEMMKDDFYRVFNGDFKGDDETVPLYLRLTKMADVIFDWNRRTGIAIDTSPWSCVDGAAMMANNAAFYRS